MYDGKGYHQTAASTRHSASAALLPSLSAAQPLASPPHWPHAERRRPATQPLLQLYCNGEVLSTRWNVCRQGGQTG